MAALSLIKNITKDSLRGIGRDYPGLSPQQTIIAGNSHKEISKTTNLKSFKIGRVSLSNAFALFDENKVFYIYVSPKYKGYRSLFKKIITEIPKKHHVDHLLSRNLASHFDYKYVLLCVIPDKVNIKHGRFEKIKFNFNGSPPSVVYFDERIYEKLLARNPTARLLREQLLGGYNPTSTPKHGLTLKQKGVWNSNFGFHIANKKFISNNFISLDLQNQ
jgi:hypothetical protein